MRSEEEKLFDEIVNYTVVKLYNISKENKKIIIKNYKNTNAQKCILCIIQSIKDMFGIQLEFILPIHKYLFFKIFNRSITCIRSKEKDGLDLEELSNSINGIFKTENVLEKIYNAYYKKGK